MQIKIHFYCILTHFGALIYKKVTLLTLGDSFV